MNSMRECTNWGAEDHIFVKNIEAHGIVGVNPEERINKQRIRVNLRVVYCVSKAGISDALDDSINYATCKDAVVDLLQTTKFLTVEALATRIAKEILGIGAPKVWVCVEKPDVLDGAVPGVAITRIASDFASEESDGKPLPEKIPLLPKDAAAAFKQLARHSTEYQELEVYVEQEIKALSSHLDRKIRVLDIGAGFGRVAKFPCLQGRTSGYCAVEPNVYMHEELRANAKTLCDDFELITDPFTAHTTLESIGFDVVFLCHSLYKCGTTAAPALIKNALNHMSFGGICLISHREAKLRKFADKIPEFACVTREQSCDSCHIKLPVDDDAVDAVLSAYFGTCVPEHPVSERKLFVARAVGGKLDANMTVMTITHLKVKRNGMLDKLDNLLPRNALKRRNGADYEDTVANIKNKYARRATPDAFIHADSEEHVKIVLRWASEAGAKVCLVGGGHSDHALVGAAPGGLCVALLLCNMSNVSVDLDEMTITAQGGATLGDIASEGAKHGVFVPVGSRPSVGMGLALHGGIGHFTREHGLTCDVIVAARVVLPSGEIVEADSDLLYAIRGGGTNFGCVVRLVFRCFQFNKTRVITERVLPAPSGYQEEHMKTLVEQYFKFSADLPDLEALDLYVRPNKEGKAWTLATQKFQPAALEGTEPLPIELRGVATPEEVYCSDYPEMFDVELHRTMGKTARDYKRCSLLADGCEEAAAIAVAKAVAKAPTSKCYVHIVHCGGKARTPEVPNAFSYREWNWALVVTGRWDGDDATKFLVEDWVNVTVAQLCGCSGAVYPADLGPRPQDVLFARTFLREGNLEKLARFKQRYDPENTLAYGLPILDRVHRAPSTSSIKTLVVVCGRRRVGKDHTADLLKEMCQEVGLCAHAVSVSYGLKCDYAAEHNIALEDLLHREKKEKHRRGLNDMYRELCENHSPLCDFNAHQFAGVVARCDAKSREEEKPVDVLIVSGLREADVLTTVRAAGLPTWTTLVTATDATREGRGWKLSAADIGEREKALDGVAGWDSVIANDGDSSVVSARLRQSILPWARLHCAKAVESPLSEKVALAMGPIPNFPSPGIHFYDIRAVLQDPTLVSRVVDWLQVQATAHKARAIVSVESTGSIFAAPVALAMGLPHTVIRKSQGAPREPGPTVRQPFDGSNITHKSGNLELRMSACVKDAVLIDDVLASGRTAKTVQNLLQARGVQLTAIIVVAILPEHNGAACLPSVPVEALCRVPGL